MYRIKLVDLQILRRRGLLFFFRYLLWFARYKGSKNCTNRPLPKLEGNNGPIVLVRGGSRFDANCYTVIFIQIGQVFRKISTDKLFRTHRQTDRQTETHRHTHVKLKTRFLGVSVLVESGNVLSSTSNF